jgi:L-ascorbate metabolism protein UlaG (beta-lactamase superfamily)
MRITHIYHSGMLVELEKTVLLFDWYQGKLPAFDHSKLVICLVSHEHHDHYDPRIWQLAECCPNIHYVLDSALQKQAEVHRKLKTHVVSCYETLEVEGIRIHTAQSNDEGVAFLVEAGGSGTSGNKTGESTAERNEAEGKTIFHSGDLNVWWWDRERAQNEASDAFFRREIATLAMHDVDVAFLPLDPRLKDPTRGVVAFMEVAGAKLVVPMHYGAERAKAMTYLDAPSLTPYRDRICFDDVIEVS